MINQYTNLKRQYVKVHFTQVKSLEISSHKIEALVFFLPIQALNVENYWYNICIDYKKDS